MPHCSRLPQMFHELSPNMDCNIVNSETIGSLYFLEVAVGIFSEMATRDADVAVECPLCPCTRQRTLTSVSVKPARWEHRLIIFVCFLQRSLSRSPMELQAIVSLM